MAINIELFTTVIQEQTFPNNTFITRGTDHSQYVKYLQGNGKESGAAVVHIPNAGAITTVTKNRASFPATASNRTDVDLTYNIDEYSVAPFYLEYSDAETVAYDKASSLLYAMTNTLKQTIGNNTAYKWSPTAVTDANGVTRILRTTGAATGPLASGATGTRLALTINDIARAKNVLDQDFALDSMRTLVIPSAMWNTDILSTSTVQKFLELGSTAGLREGTIDPQTIEGYVGKVFGFDVYTRPSVTVWSATTSAGTSISLTLIGDNGTPTTSGTSDDLGCIFFQQLGVSNAVGEVVIFWNPERAEYYGSLMSCLVRHGAAKTRTDGKLVGGIVQANQ